MQTNYFKHVIVCRPGWCVRTLFFFFFLLFLCVFTACLCLITTPLCFSSHVLLGSRSPAQHTWSWWAHLFAISSFGCYLKQRSDLQSTLDFCATHASDFGSIKAVWTAFGKNPSFYLCVLSVQISLASSERGAVNEECSVYFGSICSLDLDPCLCVRELLMCVDLPFGGFGLCCLETHIEQLLINFK